MHLLFGNCYQIRLIHTNQSTNKEGAPFHLTSSSRARAGAGGPPMASRSGQGSGMLVGVGGLFCFVVVMGSEKNSRMSLHSAVGYKG